MIIISQDRQTYINAFSDCAVRIYPRKDNFSNLVKPAVKYEIFIDCNYSYPYFIAEYEDLKKAQDETQTLVEALNAAELEFYQMPE